MRRRDLLSVLCATAALRPLAGAAQQRKVFTVGLLLPHIPSEAQARVSAFREALSERGYIEGRNVTIEYRAADGKIERLPELARELVALNVDIIVAVATPGGRAARQATATIPVVVTAMGDPVNDRLVASLARPGGNVTGTTFLGPELVPKRLAILRELLPQMSRVAILWDPGAFAEDTMNQMLKEATDAAVKLDLQLQFIQARKSDEFERAFAAVASSRADALFQFPSSTFFTERKRLVFLANQHRLPTMFNAREFVEVGGLTAYGASLVDLHRRATVYVEKILKGAKPADLPVEQPTKFELVINMKTARTLGLAVPQSLLARADEVIE